MCTSNKKYPVYEYIFYLRDETNERQMISRKLFSSIARKIHWANKKFISSVQATLNPQKLLKIVGRAHERKNKCMYK